MQRRPIWIKSRKNLLNQVKKQVLAFVGEDAEVNSYAEAYKREFFGRWERSSYQSLFADLNSAHFVLGGDFHAFSQSQRSHLRVLRHIVEQRQLIIAVECIESRYQEVLDQFLANSIDEKKFLNKVKWQSHWGFPWENYKPIFEFAKSFNIKMVAINRFYRKKNLAHLKNRDAHACRRLAAVHNTYPTALIYVIFGDLHLASEHLPKKLMTWLSEQKKSPKVVRVFLNSEKLYFKLAGQQLENQIEVMKSSRHRYCLLTSPPWVKWQGYLMYLEQAYDRDLLEDDIIDFTDRVGQLVSLIAKDVRVPVALKNLAVYRGADDNFWFHISNHLSVKDLKTVENLIVGDRSFLIPQLKIAFLSRASINHCAALAGYYVHTELCGLTENLWLMPKNFLRLIWVEAVSFFLSKLINHKRKAENMVAIKAQLSAMDPKEKGREALLLVVEQRVKELLFAHKGELKESLFTPKILFNYIVAARYLGSMMGEKLYKAHISKQIGRKKLVEMLKFDVLDKNFAEFYFLMIQRLEAFEPIISESMELH